MDKLYPLQLESLSSLELSARNIADTPPVLFNAKFGVYTNEAANALRQYRQAMASRRLSRRDNFDDAGMVWTGMPGRPPLLD
jgi:hypothetical protein